MEWYIIIGVLVLAFVASEICYYRGRARRRRPFIERLNRAMNKDAA